MPLSTPSDPQAAAFLAHVLTQTQQNISFLAAQNYITPAEAAELISRLSQPNSSSPDALVSGVNNLSVGFARAPSSARALPSARSVPPPPPRNNVQKARAIWAYNEEGGELNDLSFSAGDIIEIIEETNGDWWTGKHRGKQGLFPSNHVEKLAAGRSLPPASSSMSMPTVSSYDPSPYGMPEKAPAYQSSYAPPAPVQAPAPPAEQAPAQPPKKSRFGNLGNTMANSAAGGVGFGAGAAIGGGLVRAIF